MPGGGLLGYQASAASAAWEDGEFFTAKAGHFLSLCLPAVMVQGPIVCALTYLVPYNTCHLLGAGYKSWDQIACIIAFILHSLMGVKSINPLYGQWNLSLGANKELSPKNSASKSQS